MVGRAVNEQPPAAAAGAVHPFGVIVTADMIYALTLSTRDEVNRLTEKIGDLTDHEQRIRTLEERLTTMRGRLVGAGAVLGVFGGIVGAAAAAAAQAVGGG